jgi:septal ring factor EnvC (AmiA/AmiB activator)
MDVYSNQSSKGVPMDSRKKMQRFFVIMAALGLLLIGAGCAGNKALSTQKISLGDKAVSEAKDNNAALNAPAELNAAEGKLVQAKEALAKKDYEKAGLLAEQASIDADFARAKATTGKARKTNDEMRKNIELLRQEIERLSKQ